MQAQTSDILKQATARPWVINVSGSLEPDSQKRRPDNGQPYREHGKIRPSSVGGNIAHVYLGDQWPDDVDASLAEQHANAALIVRCVNSHERIVEALKRCRESINAAFDRLTDLDDTDQRVIDALADDEMEARAAIAAAEGGE
jgi:hypothetical protein